jgi:hypothetical protein
MIVDMWAVCRDVTSAGSGCDYLRGLFPVSAHISAPVTVLRPAGSSYALRMRQRDTGDTYRRTWDACLRFCCLPDKMSFSVLKLFEIHIL